MRHSRVRPHVQYILRVNAESEPAIALYDSLGFAQHHDYVYRASQPVTEDASGRITDD